jgi:hypothetical protein
LWQLACPLQHVCPWSPQHHRLPSAAVRAWHASLASVVKAPQWVSISQRAGSSSKHSGSDQARRHHHGCGVHLWQLTCPLQHVCPWSPQHHRLLPAAVRAWHASLASPGTSEYALASVQALARQQGQRQRPSTPSSSPMRCPFVAARVSAAARVPLATTAS